MSLVYIALNFVFYLLVIVCLALQQMQLIAHRKHIALLKANLLQSFQNHQTVADILKLLNSKIEERLTLEEADKLIERRTGELTDRRLH